jgi:hypothetical protein
MDKLLKFPLGRVVATPGALEQLSRADITTSLSRHIAGDWGELCKEDIESNSQALLHEGRLLSAYTSQDGTKFWIITEADRSATTFLLPSEY